MTESTETAELPASIERVLSRFRALGREEKMHPFPRYAKHVAPVPGRFRRRRGIAHTLQEGRKGVSLFPETRDDKLCFGASGEETR